MKDGAYLRLTLCPDSAAVQFYDLFSYRQPQPHPAEFSCGRTVQLVESVKDLFQLIFWAGGGLLIGLMWAVVGALSAVLIGILLIPFAVVLTLVFLLMPLIALVYGVVGAVRSSNGEDFRYWAIGDWALNFV